MDNSIGGADLVDAEMRLIYHDAPTPETVGVRLAELAEKTCDPEAAAQPGTKAKAGDAPGKEQS